MRAAAWGVCAALFGADLALADGVISAAYTEPTTRYDHGILGDAIEWGALELTLTDARKITLRLPQTHVFEDTAPRLVDVDLDGQNEVMVVETSLQFGARLAIYGADGLVAATPNIGRTHRWLAPIGAADLDGDGRVEIAYIDRPHLARRLTIWRFEDGALTRVATRDGLTNHAIGQDNIGGGLRDCGNGIEMITASGDWARVIATRLVNDALVSRDLGPHTGRADLNAALDCQR